MVGEFEPGCVNVSPVRVSTLLSIHFCDSYATMKNRNGKEAGSRDITLSTRNGSALERESLDLLSGVADQPTLLKMN